MHCNEKKYRIGSRIKLNNRIYSLLTQIVVYSYSYEVNPCSISNVVWYKMS